MYYWEGNILVRSKVGSQVVQDNFFVCSIFLKVVPTDVNDSWFGAVVASVCGVVAEVC